MLPMKTLLTISLLAMSTFVRGAEGPPPPADLSSPPAAAEQDQNGLAWQTLTKGVKGGEISESAILKMRYTVWRGDGSVVTHVAAPRVSMIPLRNMLPGWRQAAKTMAIGETRRAWIPSSLGGGKIAEGDRFVIDTELLDVIRPPVAPLELTEAAVDATRTASGLAYKILRAGTGKDHPKKSSRVVVHYTGWTTEGTMIDSSVLRGEPSEFGLRDVIPGWTEGLQMMSVGELRRFWIPSRLAYGRTKGKPQGMLIFDIELIAIR